MEFNSETRFFSCTCGCNAIAVTVLHEEGEIAIEVWEPRGSRLDLGYRIRQAWRVLRGLGTMQETLLNRENARFLGEYLVDVTSELKGVAQRVTD